MAFIGTYVVSGFHVQHIFRWLGGRYGCFSENDGPVPKEASTSILRNTHTGLPSFEATLSLCSGKQKPKGPKKARSALLFGRRGRGGGGAT